MVSDSTEMMIYEALSVCSGEEVARLVTDYYGMQLLDRGFYNFLIEEGYLPEDAEEEVEDEDE